MDHLCYVCLVFVILSRLFIAVLKSQAGKGLTSWRLFVMFNCVFVTFPYGILGQVCYLIASIPDLCRLSYFSWSDAFAFVVFLCLNAWFISPWLILGFWNLTKHQLNRKQVICYISN